MKKTIAVLGLGVFGREIAGRLAKIDRIDVVAFDYREEAVERIASEVPRAVIADVGDAQVLASEGADSWDAAVIALRRHFDTTVLVAHRLRKVMPEGSRIVALVDSAAEESALKALGVDQTLFLERDSAITLSKTLANPLLDLFVDLGPDIDMGEHEAPEPFIGKSLEDLSLNSSFGLTVVAVKSPAGEDNDGEVRYETTVPPDPRRPFIPGDRLLLLAPPRALERFVRHFLE